MRKLNYIFTSQTKALADERALIVRITTPTKDRAGDIVVPTGAQLDNYRKNPVVLFGHDYHDLPIARAEELSVTDEGITAKVVFPTEGTYAKADAVYSLAKQGILSTWSIGFIPDMNTAEHLEEGGYKILDWEMLEFSAVPVPANPEALTLMRSKGFDETVINELTEDEQSAPEARVVKLEIDDDERILTLNFSDDTYAVYDLNDGYEKSVPDYPARETPDITKALHALRDQLKPADKEIGLALRTLKHLLEQPNQGGGD